MIIRHMRNTYDPRKYSSESGYVQPLKDFRQIGGENLVGYYKFKPTDKIRKAGLDIRIIFQIMVYNKAVMPHQNKIPNPNISNFYIRIVYVGPRNSETYRNRRKSNIESRSMGNLIIARNKKGSR